MSHFNGTEQPPCALPFASTARREKRVVPRSFHSPSMPSFVPPATGLYLTARHTPWHPTQPTLPRYSPTFFLFLFLPIGFSFHLSRPPPTPSFFHTPFRFLSISLFFQSLLPFSSPDPLPPLLASFSFVGLSIF